MYVCGHTHSCSKRRSQALGDLDSLLGDELASINSMVEEFHTHDKEAQQRQEKEEQELQIMESKAKEVIKETVCTLGLGTTSLLYVLCMALTLARI